MYSLVHDIYVDYTVYLYDHFPISFIFNVNTNIDKSESMKDNFLISKFVNWNKMSENDLLIYKQNLTRECEELSKDIIHNFCLLNDCNSESYHSTIDYYYDKIIEALDSSSEKFCKAENKFPKCVPGWNDNLKQLYKIARETFFI